MNELNFIPRSYETTQTPPEDDLDYTIEILDTSVEIPPELALELEVLDSPEEPQTSWPESNPDGTHTEKDYIQRCQWRLGNVGHALDVVKDQIESETDAQEWLNLKMAILAAKAIGSPYDIVDPMLAIEEAGFAFVTRLNINMDAYQRVVNK